MNPFDLLGDDDTEDPSQLIAAQQKVVAKKKASTQPTDQAKQQPLTQTKVAKLPSKPLPPALAGKPLFLIYYMNFVMDLYNLYFLICDA